ncbi:hypothetical protein M0R45_030763 [Rubus argutus]|uniref:Transmembrane protein n=1 Tax=Rubus argutus TaxID=59490 RepID=A0AAW1WE23_RUBAR
MQTAVFSSSVGCWVVRLGGAVKRELKMAVWCWGFGTVVLFWVLDVAVGEVVGRAQVCFGFGRGRPALFRLVILWRRCNEADLGTPWFWQKWGTGLMGLCTSSLQRMEMMNWRYWWLRVGLDEWVRP